MKVIIDGIEYVPFNKPEQKVRFTPPTKSEIDEMIEKGTVSDENVFVGEKEYSKAAIDASVPQFFSEDGITFVMNHEGAKAFAAHLGGRVPSQDEQKEIWNEIPGSSVLEKATYAGIPFPGYFGAFGRRFVHVGEGACLLSPSGNDGGFESLLLGRGLRSAVEDWDDPKHGYSSLVVFG